MKDKLAHSINEASDRSGVGRTKLYAEIKERRLRAIKVGRRTLILEKDLAAWLEAQPRVGGQ